MSVTQAVQKILDQAIDKSTMRASRTFCKDFRPMNIYSIQTNMTATMASLGHQFCVRVGKNWEVDLE